MTGKRSLCAERRTSANRKCHEHANIVYYYVIGVNVDWEDRIRMCYLARVCVYALMLLIGVIRCYFVAILITRYVVRIDLKGVRAFASNT